MTLSRRTLITAILGFSGAILAIVIASAISSGAGGWLNDISGEVLPELQDIKPELVWGGGAAAG